MEIGRGMNEHDSWMLGDIGHRVVEKSYLIIRLYEPAMLR